jgi:formylglycine-generating enzyme required for sulfatase activity
MTLVPVPIYERANPQPLGSVLMAVTETREGLLQRMHHEQGKRSNAKLPNRAASDVSWVDAKRFCHWLTQKERASGAITATQEYRLPTDHEWSCAVGIGHLENPRATPESKSNRTPGVFPWGNTWPPPANAGNFLGEEARINRRSEVIRGFRDAQALGSGTAGVSTPNELGLRDLSGNLWEWCEDLYRPGTNWRTLRGGAWTSFRAETLESSHRTHDPAEYRSDSVGFRVVLAEQRR